MATLSKPKLQIVKQVEVGLVLDKRTVSRVFSCIFLLLPVIFTNVISAVGVKSIICYFFAFVFALYAERIHLEKWQLTAAIPWGIIFLISVFNRNAGLQRHSLNGTITLFFIILFCMLFLVRNDNFIRCMIGTMTALLTLQLVVGYVLWLNPDAYLSFGISFFHLTPGTYSYQTFVKFVSNLHAFMGLVTHYSTAGVYMSLGVILLAVYNLFHKRRYGKWNIPQVVLFVLFFFALILTKKRAHLIFGAAGILLMYFVGYVNGKFSRRLKQVLILAIVLVIALVVLMQTEAFQTVLARFTEADDIEGLSNGRITELWIPALEEFLAHPLAGIGWGQFKYKHPMSMDRNNNCHNIYIQFFCENGVFIALFIIAIFIVTYIMAWRLLRKVKQDPESSAYLPMLFAFGYQTFFLLYGFTGNPFYDTDCLFPYMISCFITYRYWHMEASNMRLKRLKFDFLRLPQKSKLEADSCKQSQLQED